MWSSLELHAGMKFKGGYGGESALNLENWPLRRAKMVAQCRSAGQLTGAGTIGQLLLLLLEKAHRQKFFARQPLTPPRNLVKSLSLLLVGILKAGQ